MCSSGFTVQSYSHLFIIIPFSNSLFYPLLGAMYGAYSVAIGNTNTSLTPFLPPSLLPLPFSLSLFISLLLPLPLSLSIPSFQVYLTTFNLF